MDPTSAIFVRLLYEKVDVWRPVQAVALGRNIYRIVEQPYDRTNEQSQFEPGALVECKSTQLGGGMQIVAFDQRTLVRQSHPSASSAPPR